MRELSGYLTCKSAAELQLRTGWDGAAGSSRKLLLQELQQHIPPSLLLPEDRLQTLLQLCVWKPIAEKRMEILRLLHVSWE